MSRPTNRLNSNVVEQIVLEELKREYFPSGSHKNLLSDIRKKLKRHTRTKPVSTKRIRRRIAELERQANLIADNIMADNISMINKKITALRLQKESLEKQLKETIEATKRRENLDAAARKAYELLKGLDVSIL